jgi:SAM-dependent methyltransferase
MGLNYENVEDVIASRLEVAHNPSISKIRGRFFVDENAFFTFHINDQRVLVAGSGLGHDAFELARHNKEVVGVELLTKLVLLSQKKQKEANIENVAFIQGDLCNLPYKEDAFDSCVLNMGTIGNFDDKKEILSKLLKISKVVYFDFYPPIIKGLERRRQMYTEEGWLNVRIRNGDTLISDDGLFSRSLTPESVRDIAKELTASVSFYPLNDFAIMVKIER